MTKFKYRIKVFKYSKIFNRPKTFSFEQVLNLAGIEAQQVVLLLEDHQFVHPAFLEMINSLLSSGKWMVFIHRK